MQTSKRNQVRGSLFLHRPSSNLFGVPSKGDTGPQEIESASPSIVEDKPASESPEVVRRSSLANEGSPVTVCPPRILEDNFMLDSLNEQRNFQSRPTTESTKPLGAAKSTAAATLAKEEKENSGHEIVCEKPAASSNLFMNALQTAISHFEKESLATAPAAVSKEKKAAEVKKPPNASGLDRHKQSPSSSYNSSNTTTANSIGGGEPLLLKQHEEVSSTEHDTLKRQYNTLSAKYNELKMSNKSLMNDYAVLRSQYEEIKAVSPFLLTKNPKLDENNV